jgi:hypothetical protein
MSSHNEGGEGWIDRIKNRVKLDGDDLGYGCVVLLFSSSLVFAFYHIVPPFLENWERPIKVGDLGRLLFGFVMLSAFFLPFKWIFFESKDSFFVKVKEFIFYALWLVALIYVLEYCLNTKGVSLSELFRDRSFRYLR